MNHEKAQTESDVFLQEQCDARAYATNLLVLPEKTQADIRAAKERVDANEK